MEILKEKQWNQYGKCALSRDSVYDVFISDFFSVLTHMTAEQTGPNNRNGASTFIWMTLF